MSKKKRTSKYFFKKGEGKCGENRSLFQSQVRFSNPRVINYN